SLFKSDRRNLVRPLARTVLRGDEDACAVPHLTGLPTSSPAGSIDLETARRETFGAVAIPAVPGVPRIDVRKGDPEHSRSIGPEHQRYATRRSGWEPRGVEGRGRNGRGGLESRRDHRHRGELGPDIPGSAAGPLVAALEQMVAHPDRVEARVLRSARDRDDLRPAHLALDLG